MSGYVDPTLPAKTGDRPVSQPKIASTSSILIGITEKKLNFDLCEFNSSVFTRKNLQRVSSASSSIQYFSDIMHNGSRFPVVLKVFPGRPTEMDTKESLLGLLYEMSVYQYVLGRIVSQNLSPNFVPFISAVCCEGKSQYTLDYKISHNLSVEPDSACVLVTGKVGNGRYFGFDQANLPVFTLGEWYRAILFSREFDEIPRVLFQVFYALELLQRFRLVHNDLHTGNVLVMQLPVKVRLGFKVNLPSVDMFSFETRYIPYLFDWDYSYSELLGDNPKLNDRRARDYGITNVFKPTMDIYTLLCYLNQIENDVGKKSGFIPFEDYQVVNYKETGKAIKLDDLQLQAVKKYKPLFRTTIKNKLKSVYKFNQTQLRDIFKRNYLIDENIADIGMALLTFRRKNGTHYAVFYNPYRCRIGSTHVNFPTPLKMLMYYSKLFQVNSLKGIHERFSYTLPSFDPIKIYIDPVASEQGRKKLEKLGVVPRFPPQKTGYVRSLRSPKPLLLEVEEKEGVSSRPIRSPKKNVIPTAGKPPKVPKPSPIARRSPSTRK